MDPSVDAVRPVVFHAGEPQDVQGAHDLISPLSVHDGQLNAEASQDLGDQEHLHHADYDEQGLAAGQHEGFPGEHQEDHQHDHRQLGDAQQHEGVEQEDEQRSRQQELPLSAEVRVVQLDLRLELQPRQESGSLARLLDLIAVVPDKHGADDDLRDVDDYRDAGLVREDSQEFPQLGLLVKLRWVLLVLVGDGALPDGKRHGHDDHQDAEEPLEFYVGLVCAQDQWQYAEEHEH